MPPVHPAKGKRCARPEWSVLIGERKPFETKSKVPTEYSNSNVTAGTVTSRGVEVKLELRDDDGNVYDATITKHDRVRYYWYPPRGYRQSNLTEREMNKRPRVYASISNDIEFLFVNPLADVSMFQEKHPELEGIYTSRGDYPEIDAEFDRFNGEHVATERMFIQWLLPMIFLVDTHGASFHFSSYAGCSCPCSPGFVMARKDKQYPRADYNVSICSRDETIIREEQMRVAAKERKEKERAEKLEAAEKLRREAAELEASLA